MATVGVLALQGATEPHLDRLRSLGCAAVPVLRPESLAGVDAVILPGGESTTMSKLLDLNGLREPLVERFESGLPVLGTCAGLILLSAGVLDGRPDQRSFGLLDLDVRRNAFGRQVDSFEADLSVTGFDAPFHAVFIRAPWVERVGPGVEVLAEVDGHPVLVRSGPVFGCSFHPELTDDDRLHRLFLSEAGLLD
ncbi:MAG: pyridoxal 5'-phosphate synthase glutaminase subunit PdxT [Actinomycetota bacterium]